MKKVKLTTVVNPEISEKKVSHASQILLAGSCFAENIGKKLLEHKFNSRANVLGISYNPISMAMLIDDEWRFDAEKVVERDGAYYHFDFHSTITSNSAEELENSIRIKRKQEQKFLKESEFLVVSFGTAWVHHLINSEKVVNNCHKQPSTIFEKRLLMTQEIVKEWKRVIYQLKDYTSNNLQIIFTVSPIRHWKDGWRENQLSKSVLHLAVDEICRSFTNCSYFPSYEILLDELRDYRFYGEDLLHPNSTAIELIWNKFSQSYFSEHTQGLNEQIRRLMQAVNHRAFNQHSNSHQDFLKKLLNQLDAFQSRSEIDLRSEIETINQQLLSQ